MLARSLLFVPGHKPELFDKARRSGADQIIVDLEDAVAPQDKAAARALAESWTGLSGAVVRINAVDTPYFEEDVALLRRVGARFVLLAKADEQAAARLTEAVSGLMIVALIETVAGFMQLRGVCRAPGVARLAFGNLDFSLDAGIDESDRELDFVRLQIALESRYADLPPPIDGVTVSWSDAEIVAKAARRARSLGFGGKLCIHPSQAAPVNQGFAASDEEIAWARRVLSAAGGGGVVSVDGKMVDAPVLRKVRAILTDSLKNA